MAFSGEPVPLRDDQSVRSLSVNEREFASSCLRKSDALLRPVDDSSSSSSGNVGLRSDGRRADEFRGPLSLSLGRSHGASTCTVRLGPRGTRAACACACELVPPPHPDRPDDGALRIRVSASPASAPGVVDPSSEDHFGGGGGGDRDGDEVRKRDRVRRLLERTLLRGGAIDTEALCVRSGEWVWRVSVDAVVLDDVGNATDAIGLAVSAALRHLRLPCVDDDDDDDGGGGVTVLRDDDREPTPLPLHHTPAYVSFALFGGGDGDGADATVAVVDPDDREELLADCPSATFAFHRHGELCSTDFPGGREIPPRGLTRLARVARATAKGLCDALEEALRDADVRAAEDRRRRLRGNAPPTAEAAEPGAAYHEEGTPEVALSSSSGRSDEERYRAEALDYANTHRAARVRETTKDDRETDRASRTASSSSSLVEAMRRTAGVPRGLPPTVDPSAPPPPLFDEGAREEFEAYAEQAAAAAEKAVVTTDDDDDDEPVTTVLRGEFDDVARRADAAEKETVATNERDGVRNATRTAKVVDENATDLAAAIIQRKGGGGTKKKKKKTKKGGANSGG